MRGLVSGLSSGLTGRRLDADKLPAFKAHHEAKHKLLREYVKVWLPKLGYSYDKVVIIDGFASAGRYREGQQGSPLYLLHSYAGWKPSRPIKNPPHFIFIESNRKFAEHLQWEVDQIDCRGATVDVICGSYEEEFPPAVEHIASAYHQPVPTFSFIDPLGWKNNPFTLISEYRSRLGNKAEVLVYVPASFMARFAEQDFVQPSLERLFGGRSFEQAGSDDGAQLQAAERLAEEYRLRLAEEFGRATRFRIDPVRRNEYYLLFGTGSPKG
jgi:three-Cys-motif partner protein